MTEMYIENQQNPPRKNIVPGNFSYTSIINYGKRF